MGWRAVDAELHFGITIARTSYLAWPASVTSLVPALLLEQTSTQRASLSPTSTTSILARIGAQVHLLHRPRNPFLNFSALATTRALRQQLVQACVITGAGSNSTTMSTKAALKSIRAKLQGNEPEGALHEATQLMRNIGDKDPEAPTV